MQFIQWTYVCCIYFIIFRLNVIRGISHSFLANEIDMHYVIVKMQSQYPLHEPFNNVKQKGIRLTYFIYLNT